MFSRRVIAVGALLVAAAAAPQARAQDYRKDGRALVLYGAGGGFNSFAHLDSAETTHFKTGFNVAAGGGYQLNRYVALRARHSGVVSHEFTNPHSAELVHC